MSFPSRAAGLRLCTALIPAWLALAVFAPLASAQLAPPTNLYAAADDDAGNVQLTWDMNRNLPYVGFRIYRKNAPASELWTNAQLTSGNLLTEIYDRMEDTWYDGDVPVGIWLSYTICAVYEPDDAPGGQLCFCPGVYDPNGCPGKATMIMDDSYIPLANRPTGGSASPLDHERMRVRWQDNSPNEDGFVIQRWVGRFSVNPEIGRVGTNVTEWIHTGLGPNTRYDYRVCAIPPGADDGTVCTDPFHGTTASPPPPPKPPAAPNTPTEVHATLEWVTSMRVEWKPGSGDGDPEEGIRVRVRRTHGVPVTGNIFAPRNATLIVHTAETRHQDERGWVLPTSIALGPNERWEYRICPYNDVGESCADPISAGVIALRSLPVEQLSGSSTAANQQHDVTLTWLDPNVFAHGEVRTEIALWSDRMNGFTTVHESAREMSPGQEPTPASWTDRGSHLRSDQAYRYRVCTLNLPLQGTDRRCREIVVRTVDAGLDAGAMTLRAHLEELRAVDVRVLRTDGRSLLPEGETCTSCPWQIGTRELRTSLERAGVRGEVNLVLLNARGATVAELGRFPVARDGSIPGLGRDLQVQGRLPLRTGEQCGLTLRVADGRGQTQAEVPFCVNRTGGR